MQAEWKICYLWTNWTIGYLVNKQKWTIKNPKLCKNGYLIQKWLFTKFGLSKWPRGSFSRSVPITTCRLLFPTCMASSKNIARLNAQIAPSCFEVSYWPIQMWYMPLQTVHSPYFSVRSSRSSTLRYGSHLGWVSKLLRGRGAVWEEARKIVPE